MAPSAVAADGRADDRPAAFQDGSNGAEAARAGRRRRVWPMTLTEPPGIDIGQIDGVEHTSEAAER